MTTPDHQEPQPILPLHEDQLQIARINLEDQGEPETEQKENELTKRLQGVARFCRP